MNIYIANFGTQFKDEQLKDLFAPHGEVSSVEIAFDVFTEKSRGFGYVQMPVDDEARAAIAALNKTEMNGHLLQVQEAELRDVRKGSYKVGSGGINPYRFKKS
jgi:RNA recognition motif-containing protein